MTTAWRLHISPISSTNTFTHQHKNHQQEYENYENLPHHIPAPTKKAGNLITNPVVCWISEQQNA